MLRLIHSSPPLKFRDVVLKLVGGVHVVWSPYAICGFCENGTFGIMLSYEIFHL